MAPKAAPKRKAPAKRALAEFFPAGEVLTDTVKKSWMLGTPIGQGGFGMLYLGKGSFIAFSPLHFFFLFPHTETQYDVLSWDLKSLVVSVLVFA